MTVDDVGACTVNCGLGQAGSNLLELTSAAGTQAAAQLFAPVPAQQIEPDGIVSGTVVNQSNGDLYIAHTALTDAKGHLTGGGDANGNSNGIVVDRFPGGYSSPVATPIPPGVISICKPYNATGPCRSDTVFHASLDQSGNSTVTTGQDFSPMAIDRAGDLYVTWSQAPVNSSGQIDGPSTIYLATSTDKGATWSAPIDVSGQLSGLKTNVFPWIAAGARGALDIVWYGTPQLGACPNQPCGSGAINGVWNVYLAQTLDAVTTSGTPNPTPAFTTTKVTEHPNHFGAICTMGIGCSTGGDRGLLDFLSVQVEPSGAADVVWADSANTDFFGESSSLIGFAHQVSGPGLYGGTVSGPTPALGSAAGSPDAYFAGNNAEAAAPAGSNVRIVSSSMSVLPVAGGGDNDNYYRIVMKLPPGSLASLSPPSMGTDTDANLIWLTRWETPNRKPSVADQGHFFYAAMESDGGGSPSFFDGETTCGLNEGTHCKYLAYPATHPLPTTGPFASGYNAATGKITLIVPVADVGGLQEAKLYSVTGLTATQAQPSCPAGSSTCSTIFNVIDSTAPYSATG
jgi:hypothetical protein